ncbi:MAG TPA: hypothetical protein VHT91_05260 [Kofleriaceae bacterium]|nr:hypothetical protein [Kofleriaceae bacterium]
MLIYIFLVAALLVGLVIVLDLMPDDIMPLSCPACSAGWSEDVVGRPRPWYVRERHGRTRCRTCHARFKEHPDGTLHPDRDTL